MATEKPQNGDHTEQLLSCPYCGHLFNPGTYETYIYCSCCGKKFNPSSPLEETVILEGASSAEQTDPLEQNPADENKLSDPRADDEEISSRHFGEYELISEIARGGMGVVYRARHRLLKRVVALKVLRSGDGSSDDDIRRFMQEAKSAASLSHANIVPIHELSIFRGQHFFTMDYIDGTPLDKILDQGPMAPYRSCELILTISRAIHYAHTRGIIHRDIKPANVIIDQEGRPLITDFGLAVNLSNDHQSQRMTRTGSVMGTIPYIPPEQAAGKLEQIGPRSDIYSLGALFYEMLTGQPPFSGMTQYDLLQRVIHQDPPPPRKLRPRLNHDLETICLKCLSKEPERRYQTAAELADDCRAFLNGEIIRARRSTAFYRMRRAISRHMELSILGAIIIVLGMFLLLFIKQARRTQKELVNKEIQHQKTELDRKRLGELVKRNWRSEFKFESGSQPNITPDRNQARARALGWYDSTLGRPNNTGIEIMGNSKQASKQASFGIPEKAPFDLRLRARLSIPTDNPGSVEFLIGLNSKFSYTESTRKLIIGVEGTPGIRLCWNDTIIAENGSYTLSPGKLYDITIIRTVENPMLALSINGEQILSWIGSTEPLSQNESYIGLTASDGVIELLSLNLDIRGMSREMMRSLLEMGESLADVARDHSLARRLYERVLREDAPQEQLIRAYVGFARNLPRNTKSIRSECAKLINSIKKSKSRAFEPGEEEYLTGLALMEKSPKEAIPLFRVSSQKAMGIARRLLPAEETYWCGPFSRQSSPSPGRLTFFNPIDSFQTLSGESGWEIVHKDAKGLFRLPPVNGTSNNSIYYLSQIYRINRDCKVQAIYPAGCQIWINGRALRHKENKNGFYSSTGSFSDGENTILLEINTQTASAGFNPKLYEVGLSLSGVYGPLSKLEEAMAILRTRDTKGAVEMFGVLQREKVLQTLSEKFSAEIKSRGAVNWILQQADEILDKPTKADLDAAWNLLEAARALDDGSGGRELALRYHKLGSLQEKAGNLSDAESLYLQASYLSPEWHLPFFEHARILYIKEDTREEGKAAFSQAYFNLPDSLELRLAAADFFLKKDKKHPSLPDPTMALQAAESAVELSGRKSPQALSYCAQALILLERPAEALQYNEDARLLEDTPERKEFSSKLRQRLGTEY